MTQTEQIHPEKNSLPIAFFDSGVGGISVLREAVRIMPNEDYLYFGDSANAPYGTKSREEILALTLAHADRFYRQGIKALVIACNTATSAAIAELRKQYTDIPVIGIEPALKPAAQAAPHPTVLVMATPLTVKEKKFRDLLGHYTDRANVIPLACPGLMEFVEDGKLEGPEVETHLESLLSPSLRDAGGRPDAIVLGCTHYPFLKKTIRRIVGDDVLILDGGEGTARELRRRLSQERLLTRSETRGHISYEESLPDRIPLCRMLMELPF